MFNPSFHNPWNFFKLVQKLSRKAFTSTGYSKKIVLRLIKENILIWFLFCQSFRRGQTNSSGLTIFYKYCFQRTTMVPWWPWCLWNWTICLNGKSQIMSLFRTKKGSWSWVKRSLASARGPAEKMKYENFDLWSKFLL